MATWRRFERDGDWFEIRREGIRCYLGWSPGKGSVTVLDDEAHAQRHVDKKVREWQRKGFAEVAPRVEPEPDPGTLVVPAILERETKPWFTPEPYQPVVGLADVVCQATTAFIRYLVLRDGGRSAIAVTITAASHDPATAADFLRAVAADRDLPFDGRSHHKVALPHPVGTFSHALFCSPALGGAAPALPGKVGSAFPIHDCEIGDADTEVLVDARTSGRLGFNHADWSRTPQPVVDLRFQVPPRYKEKTFKVYTRKDLGKLLDALPDAAPDSWVELRSYRGDTLHLTLDTLTATTSDDVDRFLLS
jgi:hypothetical protein